MRRRDFLKLSAILAGAVPAVAQGGRDDNQTYRAAAVIGVNKVGNASSGSRLPVLSAAAAGAREVWQWLRDDEKYDAHLFTDENGSSVKLAEITDWVSKLVNLGTIQELVVFFSGHGFTIGSNEVWLLSGAPDNSTEAINLWGCYNAATRSGIPNVILISDACRSGAQSLQAQNVTGGVIFPNLSASNVETVIDRLLATGAGNPAYELPVDRNASNYKAIFTSSLLNAYRAPDKEMEKLVDGILVVPNRRLKSYLKRDVNQRAQASNLTYTQTPDIRIESDDDVYIGRVLTAAPSTAPSTSSSPNTSTSTNATIDDVINSALSALGSTFRQNIEGLNKADIDWVATQTGFTDARNKILRTQSVNRETLQAVSSPPETGIIVSGAAIESVTVNPKMSAERLSTTDATTLIRIGIGEPAGSVALVFKEGTGTVVAAIESYIANIAVNNGEVIDISYILYWQSKADLEEINQIHASIGAAARFGGFRVNGDKETRVTQARAIGDRIRVEKGIDPTLGILAAYAYSDGNLQEQVNSVDNIMRKYIGVEIFDVAMLAGTLRERSDYDYHRLAPFCPMLSQGFFLIEILGKYLSKEVKGARSFLRPALWTTFDGEGMKILIGGLKNGALM